MTYLSKYGVARKIRIPMVKRGVVDHAVSADWTPATGDVKISKDGGAAANVTNLPTAIAMGNSTIWEFSITATEMQAAQINVTIGDSATKAVEDSGFDIETYGNASAQHAVDLADSVRAGLTALPNAAASAVGGLPVAVDTSGRVDVLKINGTSQTARDIGASVLLSAGTGTGQLDFTSGVVKANLAQILGTALTETAGQIAAGFKQFFNISSPTSTMNTITTVTTATTATNLTNAPTNGDLTATMKTSVTTAATAATPTAAAVTGNVGGNVVGSVASVTAGVTLAASAVSAIWDKLTSALTTSGSIGKLLVDNVDAAITSRLASASYTAPLDAAGTRSAVGLASASLDTQLDALPTNAELATALGTADDAILAILGTPAVTIADDIAGISAGSGPTASEVADAVWDEALAGHAGAGSAGEALAAIKAQTDGLSFTGDNLDVNVAAVNSTPVTGSGTDVDPWGP